ncbi:MAK10-like protein [Tanacetum coccineum]
MGGSYYSFHCSILSTRKDCKLRNDILMFQQHQGESLSKVWTRNKDSLQKVPHHGFDLWLQVQIFYDYVNPATRQTIDQSAGGKLCDGNAKESWALLEDPTLYGNECWNDPKDFIRPVKAIFVPQDIPSTSDRHLIKLKNQVQRLMKAHRAPKQPVQVNKITSSCEIWSGPHDTQYCMENLEQAFVDYASLRIDEAGGKQFAMNQGPRSFNEAANAWKGKPNFNWAHAQTFTSPRNGSFSTYSSSYQTKLEKALIDFNSYQERRLSSLRTQLGQQQDDMISKISLLWKAVIENLDDMPTRNTIGNPTTQMIFATTNYPTKEELRGKGIKSPSKLLSPKYLSQSSLAEQNRNPSSPKRVHFVNSIIILNNEDEAKESAKSSAAKYKDHEMTIKSKEEFEEETKEETEEEKEDNPKHFDVFPTMKELGYHEWLLKNPRPPWVKAKIRTGNLNNVKFSYMIGHFDKKQAYLDVESPVNVMSRLHYNWIMSSRLGPRRKPSNPKKICNFVRRVRGLKVFIGNFTYECDFMVLEDTTSVIDHDLGSVVFGIPFVEATGLVYDMKEGTVVFEKDKEKIMFKMPHKMEMFKHIDFTDIKTDRIPPFVIESDDYNSKNPHYLDSLDLGPEYKYDENVCRAIRSLIAMKAKRNEDKSRRDV